MLKKLLRERANEIAQHLRGSIPRLKEKHEEALKVVEQAKAELEAAENAARRSEKYEVIIGNAYQCPRCWINSGTHVELRSIPGDTREDIFACDCGYEIREKLGL